jgi:predicted esterase
VLGLRWPRAARARIAFGGFSGGAKCAGWLAAAFASRGRGIAGIYLAGINEDTIVSAARDLDVLDARFKRTPVFVQSGYDDTMATPVQHMDVADRLKRAGFANVRVEHFAGGHVVEPALFGTALDWFNAR